MATYKFQSTHFGQVLFEVWERTGMTKTEFARRLGVTPQRTHSIFAEQNMTEDLFDRAMAALGATYTIEVNECSN